ncbi:MAG: DUF4442 domain-containing protein [Wenzhouxiangellaceae bacterium]
MNLWPPYLAAGVRVREISPDWQRVRVEMNLHWWNRNYVGAHFGGSLFAMTDPFYMLMYINLLGREYVVWDYAARIQFMRPGKGTVGANFELSRADLDRVIKGTESGEPFLRDHQVRVHDAAGKEIARVERTLYFKLRKPRSATATIAESGG